MAQYRCDICQAEFDTRSDFRRHMQASHPKRAPSAADLGRALSGITYPAPPEKLGEYARERGEDEIADILEGLSEREYRDAADVARAFGEKRAHAQKPTYQPSKRGGEAALQSDAISAARFASLFAGMNFPASIDDLKIHARAKANEKEMAVIASLTDRRYSDMADVARAFGKSKGEDRS